MPRFITIHEKYRKYFKIVSPPKGGEEETEREPRAAKNEQAAEKENFFKSFVLQRHRFLKRKQTYERQN